MASKVSMVRGPSCVVVLQTADMLNRKRNTANGCKKVGIVYCMAINGDLDIGSPNWENPAINYELMSCPSWPVK